MVDRWQDKGDDLWNLIEKAVEDDDWFYIPEPETQGTSWNDIDIIEEKERQVKMGETARLLFDHKDCSASLLIGYWKDGSEINARAQIYQPFGEKIIDELSEDSLEHVIEARDQALDSMVTNYLNQDEYLGRPVLRFNPVVTTFEIKNGMAEASYAARKIEDAYDRMCLPEK